MGLLGKAAKVAVASSVHGRVQRRQQQRWAAKDAAAAAAAAPALATPPQPVPAPAAAPAPAAPAAPESELVTHLKQLAALRDAGILTEEEFSAKKAKLLGI